MTEKGTVAQMLRKAAVGGFEGSTGVTYKNISLLMGGPGNGLSSEICCNIADKVEAEIEAARSESLRQGAELWAKANGLSGFREGEGFGEWLDRCFLPRPLFEDGEPVQFGDAADDAECVDRICLTRKGYYFNGSHRDGLKKRGYGERVKRPEPEVLDADGVPIKVGDTVWPVSPNPDHVKSPTIVDEIAADGRVMVTNTGGWITWTQRIYLTHKEPDTQEKIDSDALTFPLGTGGASGLNAPTAPRLSTERIPRSVTASAPVSTPRPSTSCAASASWTSA